MRIQSKIKSVVFTGIISLATGTSLFAEESSEHRHGFHARPELTEAQKKCFTDQGLEAPGSGRRPSARPDRAVMEKVHACLREQGLNPPEHGPGGRGPGGPGGPPPSESGSSES